jgi:hypothetical protein
MTMKRIFPRSGGASEPVVGPERHNSVDLEETGPDEGRHFQDRAGRFLVLGLDEQALPRGIAAVPDLPNYPSLAKIAHKARLGFQAAMEIGFATQLRAAPR